MLLNTLLHKVGIMTYKLITKMQRSRRDKAVDKAAQEIRFALINKYKHSHKKKHNKYDNNNNEKKNNFKISY